ncbi:glycosyltransferase [Calothrix sp. 336/3]|uniref:glycosyltransferase n=1 Tax=Calothrix sp. 336/3 TaxID=1337936 RepID=UPI0004E3BE0B|nr:glycosyltransferase family 2 protein [Calothrix sp. 336/3]AKG23062.1 glycosyltransferase [Calothrix sp. 336/3]
MAELALFLSRLLLIWLVIQVLLVGYVLFYLSAYRPNYLPNDKLPKTALIVCLRGADSLLFNCLRSLLLQNYPNYDVKLVIDSIDDPAWKIAEEAIQIRAACPKDSASSQRNINNFGADNVQITPLTIRRYNCSLKCSSLVQAVSELDESYEVVALVDSQAIAHPNWLRTLVTPLMDPQIGATTGNRWYVPTGNNWGTLVRYLWNICAMSQMCLYQIPWSGSLALKTEVIYQTELLEKWARAYREDTMIPGVLAQYGLRVKFVPSGLILNQQECDLPGLFHWMQRQLLACRLYHPRWWLVVTNAVVSIFLPYLLLITSLIAYFTHQPPVTIAGLSTIATYLGGLIMLAIAIEQAVCKYSLHTHTKIISPAIILKLLIGIPLTQWVYTTAILTSIRMSKVTWRGITYHIKSPWNIRLQAYHPYRS